ncbi:twin-arginine translocation signal domain-containing protein [Pedobacter psychrodurus]|uniref:Twin-arginine translocation signal domain-containing protein n=1 Tax=Pedobacter psychrodurus TaxID=2530456 RepID=A0A4R0Q2D1_9SPHI|nr:twin-arginine translocation signal domain-containing protein [Pedobacter psychrodurus]
MIKRRQFLKATGVIGLV